MGHHGLPWQSGKTLITIAIIGVLITGIVGYSFYQARNILRGPKITLTSPMNGATLDTPLVHIQGNAENIAYISLNNRQIFIDKHGAFSEDLLLSPGYNRWKVEAKDKFGRSVSKDIELVLSKPL